MYINMRFAPAAFQDRHQPKHLTPFSVVMLFPQLRKGLLYLYVIWEQGNKKGSDEWSDPPQKAIAYLLFDIFSK